MGAGRAAAGLPYSLHILHVLTMASEAEKAIQS